MQNTRKHHLDGRGERSLLSTLPAADADLVGLHSQHPRNRDTELVGLDQRENERVEIVDVGSFGEVPQRHVPGHAHARLLEGARELAGEFTGNVLYDTSHGPRSQDRLPR